MIDLHMHSTISDGTEPPEVVIAHAAAAGCVACALTDHDTLEHIPAAQHAADELGITFIPGCELSCDAPVPGALHLLVYFVTPGCALDSHLGALQHARDHRNEAMIERLSELGMPLTVDEVVAIAGVGVVGRPHIAMAMIEHGYVDSVQAAFDQWLAKGRPAYVERDRLDVHTAIALAHESGGVAVVAHPHSLGLDDDALTEYLRDLRAHGLDGLECVYASYSPEERARLTDLAHALDLAPTGGSDYHGAIKANVHVGIGTGDLDVPDAFAAALAARRP